MFARLSPVLTAAALFSLIAGLGAHAQESAVLESVTAWAQKREADLQDVPLSVTSLSADDLATGGLNDVADVANRLPALDLQSSAGRAGVSRARQGSSCKG